MGGFESFIINKNDMADDAQSIGKNGKFISIAEVTVDIHLFGIRAGSSLWGHETISHLVRINVGFVFIESLEFFDQSIQGFGIIFCNKKFNT